MAEYENLLENVYKNLPERAKSTGERFEIPKFESFAEGNKTFIKNFDAVCSKLRRDKQFVMKFFSKELAVPVTVEGERVVVNRKIFGDMLNKKLEEFTNKFVICKECKKPDTNIVDLAHGLRQLVCEACGSKSSLKG